MSKVTNILSVVLLAATAVTFQRCEPNSTNDNPAWVQSLVTEYQGQPVTNPPREIWRYTYQNQTVYYVPPICCDQLGDLYDKTGEIICHPDGGISGQGDGKCADFTDTRTDEALIWRDNRAKES